MTSPSTGGLCFLSLFLLLSICFSFGCAATDTSHQKSASGLQAIWDSTRVFIEPDQLQQVLDEPQLVLLHVGHGERGYRLGHIPGARYVDFKEIIELERDGLKSELPNPEDFQKRVTAWGIGEDSAVVLYGDAAGVFPSRLYVTMQHYGCGDRVRLLNGHLRGWVVQESELDTSDSAASDSTLPGVSLTILHEGVSGVIASTADIDRAVERGETTMLDVRPEDQYAGLKRGPGVKEPGQIPGAVNMPLQQMVTGVKPPWLVNRDQLKAELLAIGVEPNRPVVVYDAQGMHSALAFAVLKELGYRVSLYDAGYAAWSKR
ncbi:sulfurtransferase [Algisphaera agarilytica]|uniref:Thiosulfate/3-mercaptopyruvate sulfurtransferase n=1 Tax=Algisphaera agarilytica TaxID=1385975 RepID=A0A7X0HAX4_9BACT|nr:rhodanese-like domain-containing protein [Algisphaera agarilytica]MBB6431361.1 thiosulfate/3-mercaptopyruvate sulfurtransferase [Algisphaera agarilytica]